MHLQESFILGIIQNIAILLTFSMLYDYFWNRSQYRLSWFVKIISGVFVGIMGVILILTPWTYKEGLFFDTRSVLLSTSGFFLGFTPTGIAVAIVSLYRYMIGGPGAMMGVAVAISSGLIGLVWARIRKSNFNQKPVRELLYMGMLVHLTMMLCAFLLPAETRLETQKRIVWVVMIAYPLANVLLGLLMLRQRKNAENKRLLDLSEERWRFALEGSGDGVWDWNPQSNEVFYSNRWKQMLGYEIDEIDNNLGEWNKLLHPEDYERVCEELNKMLRGEVEVYEAEQRLLCKDGAYRWILDRGKVMKRSDDGKPLRCIGTHKDIHQQKLAEEKLLQYKEQLKQFACHLQDARESERLLLAREIHDELGQILVAVKIEMGMMKQKMLKIHCVEEHPDLIVNFEHILELVDNTINTTRKIMTDLRPEVLNMLGFLDAAKLLITNFEKRYQIECHFLCDEKLPELDMQHSLTLYRILQESLNNIAKHSKATEITIEFKYSNNELTLIINDNGIGIRDSDRQRVDSYGLIGMNERVSSLDGELSITGKPGEGTLVKTVFKYIEGQSNHDKNIN